MKTIIEMLSHTPYGVEHPHQQDPDERFPRHPLAGKVTELGARTFPPSAASRVWATWRSAGLAGAGEMQQAEARLVARGGTEGEIMQFATSTIRLGGMREGDTWRVALPAFAQGEKIEYQLHAAPAGDDPEAELHSGVFSFTVQDWQAGGVVVSHQVSDDVIAVQIASAVNGVRRSLRICLAGDEQIQLRLSAGDDLGEGTGSSLHWQVLNEDGNGFSCVHGLLQVNLEYSPFLLSISRADRLLLQSNSLPEWLFGEAGSVPGAVRWAFHSPVEEGFYGLGERYNAFNLRGYCMDASVYEQYKNQGVHTYLPVPFFLSSMGYGFYLDTARFSTFDLAGTLKDTWQVLAECGGQAVVTFHLFAGAGPLENMRMFGSKVGLPALPPDWVFGHWMSSNEWNSQAMVMERVAETQAHGIPATVLVIEAWSDEKTFYTWNDAVYAPRLANQAPALQDFTFPSDGLWPDPKGMIDELHRLGIRLLLWQNPVQKYLGGERHAQQDADEAYMLEKNYCLRWPDGTPYRVRPFWFHDSLLLDFSNPEAVAWWMSNRAYLLDELGVDGFKTDGGEHLWGREVVFANGMRGDEGINLYPNLYVGAYYRFANQKRAGDAVTFSRAGFTGAQAFPCHWAGDENSTWQAFRASLVAGLSAGISGLPFWGWDIGGFSGEVPTAELYLRSAAMAAFCPIMQYHSEFNDHRLPLRDRTPWNIAARTSSPEVIDIYRMFVQERMNLLPYIVAEAKHCAQSGEPLMRPLFLDWPEDAQCWQIADQYCFGRELLVAPILEEGVTMRQVYLPAGEWKDFWSDTRHTGNQWVAVPAPLDRIPVFKRMV